MSVLTSAKPGAFLCTRDRATAKAFFRDKLGFTLTHEDDYALVFDLNGTNLRISPVKEFTPQPFTVLGWNVVDVPAAVKALTATGVEFARFEGLEQDALGIWSPGGDVKVAWFKDPDGNLLSVSNG
jgi:catechol 2,3-dioxygenase-like lactoylglutathione lyase family enzyme